MVAQRHPRATDFQCVAFRLANLSEGRGTISPLVKCSDIRCMLLHSGMSERNAHPPHVLCLHRTQRPPTDRGQVVLRGLGCWSASQRCIRHHREQVNKPPRSATTFHRPVTHGQSVASRKPCQSVRTSWQPLSPVRQWAPDRPCVYFLTLASCIGFDCVPWNPYGIRLLMRGEWFILSHVLATGGSGLTRFERELAGVRSPTL